MGILGRLRTAIGSPQPAEIRRLGTLVPPDAEYCTIGLFQVFADPHASVLGEDLLRGFRHDYSLLPPAPDGDHTTGVLVLRAAALQVVTMTGSLWSCPLNQVREVDAHRHSGFVVAGPHDRLLVSNQMPAPLPPHSTCRTAGRVTNRVFGWDAVLAPYGVTIRW